MSTEVPKSHDSSGETETNSDSENSSSSGSSGSDWECSGAKQSSAHKPHFSVTSCDTGLKLKIAAIPRKTTPKKKTKPNVKKKETPKAKNEKVGKKKKSRLSESSSSSESCSKCSSDSSSDDDIPLKAVSKLLPVKSSPQKGKASKTVSESEEDRKCSEGKDNTPKGNEKQSARSKTVQKTKSDEANDSPVKRPRGRPRTKFTSPVPESAAGGSSTSSSTSSSPSSSSSSSSTSSSSESDSPDAAANTESADDSTALAAACQLQVIDDADLAALFPEQTASAPPQPNFSAFAEHAASPDHTDKSIADNGDGSSSEMELTPQLVTAAIQRATADSSGSENECSNSDNAHHNTTHYASSLLQQFVAQTQLLSSTAPLPGTSLVGLNPNPIEGVGPISDCVLGQINTLPEIAPIAPNFLTDTQHLSPQQTEELTQINKDLEEITSGTESVGIAMPNPPSLEDCVDNNDFMNLDIAQSTSELGNASDMMKNSPLTVNTDMGSMNIDTHKFDTASTHSVESQEDVKNVVVESRRKRGRPRKVPNGNKKLESRKVEKPVVNIINDFHNGNDPPNVSPDSGILSNHNSPTHSPCRRHDDDAQNRLGRKVVQKENNTGERRSARSKSKSRSRPQRSDSSDCDYRKKRIENEIKQIKTEAPSPIPLKQEQNKYEKTKKNDHKLDIAALDRMLYATDRVLYPPRKKVGRKPQNKAKSPKSAPKTLKDKNQYDSIESEEESVPTNRSVLSGVYAKRKELNSKLASLPKKTTKTFGNTWRDNQSENEAQVDDHLDPTWKQIDLNPKYKDILSGYKSDHEIKPYKSCSRLMESGYKSDYGGCRSGYKSDYHRSSGYKTDYKSGYKSDKSGYKTDYSVRSMRRRTRKLKKTRSVRDRSYYKNQKHFVSDQEILLLTNKTFSSLTLGHSSSDSECDSYLRKSNASPKYVSVCTKYPLPSNYNFGFSKLNKKLLRVNPNDPFAPGPVFSGLQRPMMTYNIFKLNYNNNNTLVKSPTKSSYIGKPLPALKPSFTHKFGASPISTLVKSSVSKKDDKGISRTLSPRNRKSKHSSPQSNTSKKETVPKPLPSIFEKAKNSYIPNKLLSRNVFLNAKKPYMKPSFHTKKHRRTVVLAPPKINLKPLSTERPSRITVKTENKHHRHRSKRRHRSRSVSRSRDTKSIDLTDQKFSQDLDNLVTNFIKLCQVAPKLISVPQSSPRASPRASPKHTEKTVIENKTEPPPPATTKVAKRGSKKRKTADNPEIATPTSKRRHKKQQTESQSKGGKDTNEHKLPLKKRHYHINSSTSNSLSLSLMPSEFDENSKNGTSPEKFLCTETDCMGETQNSISAESPKLKTYEKAKKAVDCNKNVGQPPNTTQEVKNSNTESTLKSIKPVEKADTLEVKITENSSTPTKNHSPNSLNATDDELASIKKPSADQSELSKKIYETSEKLKAVHKLVHDLEKSLPKTKEGEVKTDPSKQETQKTASPRAEAKQSPIRNSAPIVTPKKRHRLEADKAAAHSSLDQVVQSLSKKLSEDKASATTTPSKDVNQNNSINDSRESDVSGTTSPSLLTNANIPVDPLKSMSARTLYKSAIPPAQKSEIMTRKKNRLEGLTSNLVSKINPSAATKVLDTLLNNNIRKSIESRILEKEKNSSPESNKSNDDKNKNTSQINTRATVIKSPVSKGKVLETKKSKAQEPTAPSVVVNVDKPTGIFEPSVDLEDQIPKSSISVNNAAGDSNKAKPKTKGSDSKNSNPLLTPIDTEAEIPLALISETPEPVIRPKRGESIAAALSDKLQETGGHNLRQTKRNLTKEVENESDDTTDKKKKKTAGALIRESKLVLPSKMLIPKVQAERLPITDANKKINLTTKPAQKEPTEGDVNKPVVEGLKKKARRRKAINRTGFPSVKRKKKKMEPSIQMTSDSHFTSDTDNNSAFERVPKDGEAMSSFLERTNTKKPELKVVLNKDECPKQARLTVVALEKLQGKEVPAEINKTTANAAETDKKNTNASILRAPALQLKQNRPEKDVKSHVNKWEVLSETDSIPSLGSSLSNDPEDCIPLSLLNLKERPGSKLDNLERMKRKTRALSPSQEIEEILSKRKNVEKNSKMGLRPKSSLAVLCPSERRLTRSFDSVADEPKAKPKKVESKKPELIEKPDKPAKPVSIATRRKSRSCQANKKIREVHSSSRESSIDTVVSRRLACKSREPSVDTLRDHDENDPLPLNEKEIDFEKSIDVLSKSIICKKRVASSRDDSPASSVDNREKAPVVSKRNPRLRKKFLVAGLFSDYYKEDPKPEGKGKNLVTQTDFPPGLLSPPPYCERWVRRRTVHFSLPYDIWWQHHYNQPVPSWNYKKIRTNVYYDVKPSADECESVACHCAPASGCNEDCINRLVFAECSSQLCPCGDKCKNQRIQRHEWASGLEKFMTENKGWGVRTKETIAAGDFILEYVGEVVSDKEFKERMATRYARDTHHYCLHLDGGTVIDGHRMGGDGRFVNHSCRPNCEMQKWTSNGTFRMALFALRDIEPGEELTYDYNFSLFNPAVGQPCKCDSIDCRGVIGGKSQRVTKPPVKAPPSRTPSSASSQSAASTQPRVGRPRKAAKCNKKCQLHTVLKQDMKNNMTILKYQQHLNKLWQEPQMKPLSAKERSLVKERHCFLFRNLDQVRRIRERLSISMPPSPPQAPAPDSPPPAPPAPATAAPPTPAPVIPSTPVVTMVNPLELPDTMNPRIFIDRLQKLREGGKEKKLLRVEDDPSLSKKERWGKVLKAVYSAVVEAKDEKEKPICAPLLKPKPTKSDAPVAPDLTAIQANLNAGKYDSVAAFDADMNAVFANVLREQGRLSTLGAAALQLRKVYNTAKAEYADQLTKILGPEEPLPLGFLAKTKTEEVILCICGLHVEEGLMVQCGGARCGVWQHARCMRVQDTRAPHYCHHCSNRQVDREIPLDDYTEDGHQFYLSLMRGDLQVRQGDTVYVLRDIPIDEKHPDVSQKGGDKSDSPKTKRQDRKKIKNLGKGKEKEEPSTGKESSVRKHTYQTIGPIPVSELDIFRVERLWKHKDTQERYVYGHHYLRPHETFHEPTRKFFHNEVMRVPLYEAVPIELVMSQCWVMDLNTYCKGRPVGAMEEHVYICELRVDRTARLFTKVSRPKYPIPTKHYAFHHFPQRVKITRTYAPHEVSPEYLKGRAAKSFPQVEKAPGKAPPAKDNKKKPSGALAPVDSNKTPPPPPALPAVAAGARRQQQKERVNNIARRLLARLGSRAPLDASYLLQPRRQRQRQL